MALSFSPMEGLYSTYLLLNQTVMRLAQWCCPRDVGSAWNSR